ncbi:MAG: hypothetical protein N4A47_05945 [Clostridia bacterium]|jgi:hypothetical protein|nr:hypothetical protein [Clostridia bacterium]
MNKIVVFCIITLLLTACSGPETSLKNPRNEKEEKFIHNLIYKRISYDDNLIYLKLKDGYEKVTYENLIDDERKEILFYYAKDSGAQGIYILRDTGKSWEDVFNFEEKNIRLKGISLFGSKFALEYKKDGKDYISGFEYKEGMKEIFKYEGDMVLYDNGKFIINNKKNKNITIVNEKLEEYKYYYPYDLFEIYEMKAKQDKIAIIGDTSKGSMLYVFSKGNTNKYVASYGKVDSIQGIRNITEKNIELKNSTYIDVYRSINNQIDKNGVKYIDSEVEFEVPVKEMKVEKDRTRLHVKTQNKSIATIDIIDTQNEYTYFVNAKGKYLGSIDNKIYFLRENINKDVKNSIVNTFIIRGDSND